LLWFVQSVVVVTCCSLSGLSPFAGDTDAETLANVTTAEFDFDAEEFSDVTRAAKDFIEKLLIQQPKYVSLMHLPSRFALSHPVEIIHCDLLTLSFDLLTLQAMRVQNYKHVV